MVATISSDVTQTSACESDFTKTVLERTNIEFARFIITSWLIAMDCTVKNLQKCRNPSNWYQPPTPTLIPRFVYSFLLVLYSQQTSTNHKEEARLGPTSALIPFLTLDYPIKQQQLVSLR